MSHSFVSSSSPSRVWTILLVWIAIHLFIASIITPVTSLNKSQSVDSSSSSSSSSAASGTTLRGTSLRGVTLRGSRPQYHSNGQTRRGSAATTNNDPLSSSPTNGCGPYGELDDPSVDGVSYAFVRCSNPDYQPPTTAAAPSETAVKKSKLLTPLRRMKEQEAEANGPIVLPFFSDFAPMSNNTYSYKVPLTTVLAYRNVSLVDIPSPLIPHEWNVTTDIGDLTIRRIYADPMVLTMDQFVTSDEIERIIAAGHEIGFRRSLTTAGLTDARTSQSAYLPEHHSIVKMLSQRVSTILRIPSTHIEFGPVLKYDVGQLFDYHYDSTLPETNGRRLTFFVPLSSVEDEDGGHTGFPMLNFKFPPKNGTAIIWRNYEPTAEDDDHDLRMEHGGEPPKKGTKYAINMWIYNSPYVHFSRRNAQNKTNPTNQLPSNPSLPQYPHQHDHQQSVVFVGDVPPLRVREMKLREAESVGPTVQPFYPDFAPMTDQVYSHKIPLTTIRAHRNVSLVDLPAPLIPHQWRVYTDLGYLTLHRVFAEPMILTLEKFVSQQEIEALISLGNRLGFERSLTLHGLSKTRTSGSAYIPDQHPLKKMLANRVAKIVRLPTTHIEFGPILKYEVGQMFDYHHDSTLPETFGRRLTFFVPLSSVEDEDGGHTGFPLLNYKFPPKNGTAIIWRNYEPSAEHHDFDRRMKHGGEPPKKGIKYAINMWIYNTPYVHWSLRQAFMNLTQTNSTHQANYTLPTSLDQIEIRPVEPTTQSILTVRNDELTHPWVKSLDHGNVTIYPSIPPSISPSFLILRVPDFLTLDERQSLIAAGHAAGWHRDPGATSSSGRTCSWTWIHETEQQMKLRHRISRLLTVPVTNIEITFLVRYQVGEYYHPFFDSTLDTIPDRLITIHMILHSELDEDGGELYFPSFPSTVARYRPLPGLASIWRNYPPAPVVPPGTPRPIIEHEPLSQHGFEAPKKGTIYAMTAFVFPYTVKMRGENGTSNTAASSGA